MCIRDSAGGGAEGGHAVAAREDLQEHVQPRRRDTARGPRIARSGACLLYTSDAADERSSVDLGGRRIIKKKKKETYKNKNKKKKKTRKRTRNSESED